MSENTNLHNILCADQLAYEKATPIYWLTPRTLKAWLSKQDQHTQAWVNTVDFQAKKNTHCLVPDQKNGRQCILLGCTHDPKGSDDFWSIGSLPAKLPPGDYRVTPSEHHAQEDLALVWGMACYQFDRYKKKKKSIQTRLVLPSDVDLDAIYTKIKAVYLVRDLINTPAEDMGPSELADVVRHIASTYQASLQQIIGKDLLTQNYPAIYQVGRGADDAPRLLDLTWGESHHPKCVIIGKGVCFDSGGLQLKSPAGILEMKKDMAGAAHALALAQMIMANRLPIQLRLLIPAVENAISSRAYKPGDVVNTRKNIQIEITNTDAEGRLVLADALTEACLWRPNFIVNFATLTGASRIALGPDLPALFSNHDTLAQTIIQHGKHVNDPLWHMPLYKPYRAFLKSHIADMVNAANTRYGGSITAALFLESFVEKTIDWVHIDLMGSYTRNLPARPKGGAAMGLRALYDFLKHRYTEKSARSSAG